MPEFKKNDRFSGGSRKPFNRDSRPPFRGGGRDFGGPKEMFDAECANCHKMTQVPFRPNGTKPVFCRDCFKPTDDRGFSSAPRFEKKSFGPRKEFTPSAARPDTRIDDLKRQVEAVNVKLDRLVSLIEDGARKVALSEAVRATGTTTKEKTVAKKVVKKAKKSK